MVVLTVKVVDVLVTVVRVWITAVLVSVTVVVVVVTVVVDTVVLVVVTVGRYKSISSVVPSGVRWDEQIGAFFLVFGSLR
jgi:hypothetical protein